LLFALSAKSNLNDLLCDLRDSAVGINFFNEDQAGPSAGCSFWLTGTDKD